MNKSLHPGRETFTHSLPRLIHQTGTAEQQIPEDAAVKRQETDTDWPAVLEPEPVAERKLEPAETKAA